MKGTLRAIAVLLACVLAFGGLRLLRAESGVEAVLTQRDLQEAHGVPVEVGRVEQRTVQREVRVFGTARGARQSEIFVPSPNLLERLHVSVGQEVAEGQQLLSMRQVALSPLGYPFVPLRVKNEVAQADLERYEALFAQEAITEQEIEHARAMASATRADFDAARAAVVITSPIRGTVTRIDFREGEMVPNDRPVMQVAEVDRLHVDFMVEPVDVGQIEEGQAVDLVSAAVPGRSLAGAVVERALAAHPMLAQYRVRVEAENPGRAFLPGYPIEGDILLGGEEPVIAVSPRALVEVDGVTGVWVVDGRGAARFEIVAPGISDGEWVAVDGNLEAGQQVVTLGRHDIVRDGQAVLVVGD